MTEVEFNAGWRLLLLQPWAYRYKAINEFGELSSDAHEQRLFYFEQLKACDGKAWLRIAKEYAKGKEWPALDTLKRSLSSVVSRSTESLDPTGGPLLSLDEFGRDLYDAIRLQSGQVQQEKNAVIYEKQGLVKMAKNARDAASALRDQLTEIFQRNTVAPDDLRRVLMIGSEKVDA